jgi:hypothetical protein
MWSAGLIHQTGAVLIKELTLLKKKHEKCNIEAGIIVQSVTTKVKNFCLAGSPHYSSMLCGFMKNFLILPLRGVLL